MHERDLMDEGPGTRARRGASGHDLDERRASGIEGRAGRSTHAGPGDLERTTPLVGRDRPMDAGDDVYVDESRVPRAAADRRAVAEDRLEGGERTIQLREEELVAHKDLRDLGEVVVRTEVQEFPGRLEVDAIREEVQVEHVPVGQIVRERQAPWEEGDTLMVPVYEEQLVVVKRLVHKENLHIRRVATTERVLFEDTLRRDHLIVEDPDNTGLVREQYDVEADDVADEGRAARDRRVGVREEHRDEGGVLGSLVRKVLQ